MGIMEESTEAYSYDISRFLGYVSDFDGFLPVLLSGRLAFKTLTNHLFDHTVRGWRQIRSLYHLLWFGRSQMSKVVCSLDDFSL